MGTSGYKWDLFWAYAKSLSLSASDDVSIQAGDDLSMFAEDFMLLQSAGGDITLSAPYGDITLQGPGIVTEAPMYPGSANVRDIGTSALYYRYVYASRHYYKTAPTSFDIIDDLQALKGLTERRDREGGIRTDPMNGVPQIEPTSLPWEVLARYEEDVPAETYLADDGSIIQLAPGHKKGELIVGPDGQPFIDAGSLLSFTLGSARKLALLSDEMLARIGRLENGA
jgi:hypothetical protein